eukprot:2993244-Pyramimonas_sp.AAC.1
MRACAAEAAAEALLIYAAEQKGLEQTTDTMKENRLRERGWKLAGAEAFAQISCMAQRSNWGAILMVSLAVVG